MAWRSLVGSTLVAGSVLLAGCASKVPSSTQYSGFLGNYSDLQQTTSASGAPVLRWIDPNFNPANYSALIYEPVVYYPRAQPSGQVGQQALDGLLSYTNTKFKTTAEQRFKLVQQPGPGVLIFRGAITAVDTSDRDLKPRELIPVALVIAGTRAATGNRPRDTNLYFEGEFLDSVTKQPVVKMVRKGRGTEIANAEQKVTSEDLKSVVDALAADAAAFDAVTQGRTNP